jgi:hypothetical protein
MAATIVPYAFGNDNQSNRNLDDDYDAATARIETVGPPWVSVPQTVSDFHEYSKIFDEAEEKLAKILAPYGNNLTRDLFVKHFDEIEEALIGMNYPYEKEGVVDVYLDRILGRDGAIEFIDDLIEYECYSKLFDSVPESSSNERDENVIPVACVCEGWLDDTKYP